MDTELASVRAATQGVVDNGPNEGARKAAAVRAQLASGLEGELTSLRFPSARTRLQEIAMVAGIWVVGGALVLKGQALDAGTIHWIMRAAGTLVIALALHIIALLLHDGVHHTLFRNRRMNRLGSVLLGACVLMSAGAYQAMHERHHIFLGDPRDPDDYHNYSGNPRVLWLMHYMRLFLGAFLYIAFIPLLVLKRASPPERRRALTEYGLLLVAYIVAWIVVPHEVLIHAWLLPIFPAGLMLNIRSIAAHGLTDSRDPLLASRSIDAHPVVAFFFRNENYHLEHHLFPEIPSYNLRTVHELVFPRMPRAATARSYLAFLAQFVRQSRTLDETPIGIVRHDN